jgi:L-lactate dehydrogenase complex protein LldG
VSARAEVLARIRTALGSPAGGDGPVPCGYRTASGLRAGDLLSLLADRLTDYGSNVRRCGPAQQAQAVIAALAERGARRVVVPPGLVLPGVPGGVELVVDDGLATEVLDTFDAVVTVAAVAIAETGTIVLDGSTGQGRRALSLVPDYHLCVVRAAQVVGLVTEALPLLDPRRPLTWVSGPSATSDIELDRVQGVHGPRTLEVVLISEDPSA